MESVESDEKLKELLESARTVAVVGIKDRENEDAFRIVGKQMGDAVARKKDRDVIALFSALNGGTAHQRQQQRWQQ